jgi:hypothetical protein
LIGPGKSIVVGEVYTLDKIFEPLYISNPSGVLTPWLAQGHKMSSDGKAWTFALRPGGRLVPGCASLLDTFPALIAQTVDGEDISGFVDTEGGRLRAKRGRNAGSTAHRLGGAP